MGKKTNVPEIRFRGFEGAWEDEVLGNKASFSKGQGYSKNDLVENGTPIILYGRLYTKYQTTISVIDTFTIPNKNSVYSSGNEVIVPSSGETSEEIARAAAVVEKGILLGGDLNIIIPNSEIHPIFLALILSNGRSQKELSRRSQGKTVVHLHNSGLKEVGISFPSLPEQTRIGSFFKNLDRLITLKQCKLDKLKNVKKSMLEKMFPREGANLPEIRFQGFLGEWERKSLGECVLIQRGGSPRPIESFITKDETGVNWIKIGDVKSGTRYITSTEERIIPEGKKKSREVKAGDLILSNSMSFGRPYILAINGCIHDGWLLIRNEQDIFVIDFLFQILSSDSMLKQYKSLAAGGVVNNLNSELVKSTSVLFPNNKSEQSKIGTFFKNLDRLISLQQKEIEKLKQIKSSCLNKMFV